MEGEGLGEVVTCSDISSVRGGVKLCKLCVDALMYENQRTRCFVKSITAQDAFGQYQYALWHTSSVVLTIFSTELKYLSHRNCVCDLIESSWCVGTLRTKLGTWVRN